MAAFSEGVNISEIAGIVWWRGVWRGARVRVAAVGGAAAAHGVFCQLSGRRAHIMSS